MRDIHQGLPVREFVQPEGIVELEVSARSGLLPPANYSGRTVEEVFIAGTQPTEFDRLERFDQQQQPELVERLRTSLDGRNFSLDSSNSSQRPSLDLSLDTSRFDSRSFDVTDDEDSSERTETQTTEEDSADSPREEDRGGNESNGSASGINPLLD
jgi:penicillin-binding protein 1A